MPAEKKRKVDVRVIQMEDKPEKRKADERSTGEQKKTKERDNK